MTLIDRNPSSIPAWMEGSDETLELMARTGARVRAARSKRGWSRQTLSEASGVSLRYLAQLESGGGNISIGRLDQVARALGAPLDSFLREAEPRDPEIDRLATLLRNAPPERRAQAIALLAPASPARRIALIGLRGAGKSTLGAAAAEALGLPFMQLNAVIEADAGMPVAEIMALYGPDGYRRMEAAALEHVSTTRDALILEVAGGIVAETATFAALLERFHTIWVKASPEEHMARVRAQGDLRPMAGTSHAMAQLRDILKAREPLYGRADAQIDTSGKGSAETLDALLALIGDRGFLQDGG